MKSTYLIFVVLALFARGALAHEVRPAYLELRQTGAETYDVLWKVPGRGENLRLGLYVKLPAGCMNVTEPRASMANNTFTERWTFKRTNGLIGGTIHITGLSATMTDVLVRLECLDGTTQVTRLTPSAPSFVVVGAPGAMGVARTYFVLGVEHILSGIDHLLFVLALLIIVMGASDKGQVANGGVFRSPIAACHWPLLIKTITAFTVAHSITLTLAALGYVHVPQRPVEAVIALSIVFVAAEILRGRQGSVGITARAPWVVALIFGLMHGLGFASGLSEAGLPEGHIPTALLFFSLGVEAGHFLFIGVVLSLIALALRVKLPAPQWAQLVPPYAIGSVAMFWVIQRIAAF